MVSDDLTEALYTLMMVDCLQFDSNLDHLDSPLQSITRACYLIQSVFTYAHASQVPGPHTHKLTRPSKN